MKREKYIEIVTTRIGKLDLISDRTLNLLREILSRYYSKIEITIISKKNDLKELIIKKPDLVISTIKYIGFDIDSIQRNSKNKIWFSEFLDKYKIPYTGSSKKAIELEFDKSKAKDIVSEYGCKTAPYFIANPNDYTRDNIPIDFPLFIKPLYEGNSRGIDSNSLVHNFNEYQKKVSSIYQNQGTSSLVEKYLIGKEYTAAIFQKSNTYKVYPIELVAEKNIKGNRILGFIDKVADKELTLKIEDDNIEKMISKLALDSFRALGAKGHGRVDIRMDKNDVPYFLEANLIPGLSEGYLYRCYNLSTGLTHEQMILDIVRNALETNTTNR